MTPDAMTLALLTAALAATGALAGILAGLLGVGGGIVVVPVLFHVFHLFGMPTDVGMHLAVGTSLATIIPTSIVSARAHRRRGSVDEDFLKRWTPGILVGVLIGTALAGPAKGQVLTAVFGVVALVVALHMGFNREGMHLGQQLPTGPVRHVIGAGIGGFSAMMGIGGGTIGVPVLSLFNYPIKRAVGTASALGLIIGIPGTLGFILSGLDAPGRPPFSVGWVSLLGFAVIAPTQTLLAPYGAAIAHKVSTRMLRRLFAIFLAITAARMLVSTFG
jgi:uncharacterized membrane protein YfcA